MKLTTTIRNAIGQELIDAIATGSTTTPLLQFYTGSMPSSVGGGFSETKLAELALDNAVGSMSSGVLQFDAITQDTSADATGEAGWARVLDRDGSPVMYLSVGDTAGATDIVLNTTSIVSGTPVLISSAQITIGGA